MLNSKLLHCPGSPLTIFACRLNASLCYQQTKATQNLEKKRGGNVHLGSPLFGKTNLDDSRSTGSKNRFLSTTTRLWKEHTNAAEGLIQSTRETVTSSITPRNMGLAEVIRNGLSQLNQFATEIQKQKETQRPLFKIQEAVSVRERKASAFQERLLRVSQQCLLELSRTKGLFQTRGDVIMLVDLKMTSHRTATIYWCLPPSVLMSRTLSNIEKQYLEFKMHEQIRSSSSDETGGGAGRLLSMKVHTFMSRNMGYPPKIRLEPAKDEHILEIIESYTKNDSHDHGDISDGSKENDKGLIG